MHGALTRRALLTLAAAQGLPECTLAHARPPALTQQLPDTVRQILESTGLPRSAFGLFALPVRPLAPPLLSLNAAQSFQMASTAKLVTALAALDLLGPDYRWHTVARLSGPLREGRLLGDLIISGGGDPSLRTERLRSWLSELRSKGLREIWGDIVLDRGVFDLRESDHALTPPPAVDQPGYVRPEGLMLDAGLLRVVLQGGIVHTRVQLQPRQAGLPIVSQLKHGSPCQADVGLERSEVEARLIVRGKWAAACGEREIAQFATTHAELLAGATAELWRETGGRLMGRVRALAPAQCGEDCPTAPLPWATLPSPPLAELMSTMNKVSDNLIARALFLSLAGGFPRRPATVQAARTSVSTWLRARGLEESDLALDNGAGLSYAERCRPRSLAQLLMQAWHGPHAKRFVASLPIAGIDGTLWRRMTAGPARGRAHLKTGSGIETRSLAGYVRCASGRTVAFTAFVNHPEAASTVPALDAIVEWVALHG